MKFATKLTLLFSGLFLILCFFITSIVTSSSSGILERTIQTQMERRTAEKMDRIDKYLFERDLDTKMMATDSILKSKNPSPELITARLKELLKNSGGYISLSFFDMSRKRIVDTLGQDVGKIHSWSEYWPDVESGKDSVLDMYFSESLQLPVFHIAKVVKNEAGVREGVLVARVSTEWLDEIVKHTAMPDIKVEIVNKNGLVIYSSYNRNSILKERSIYWENIKAEIERGTMIEGRRIRLPGMEEEIVLYGQGRGYRDYTGNGWILIAHVPSKVVFAPAIELRNRLIIIMSAIGGFSLLVILLFARTVSNSLIKLSAAAGEIGRGKLDVKVAVDSNDEVALLATNLNEMATNLSIARKDMEKGKEEAEVALTEANFEIHELKNIVESNTDIFYVHNLEGKLIKWNRALEKLTGLSRQELMLKPALEFVCEKDRPLVSQKMREVFEKGFSMVEARFISGDGTLIPHLCNGYLIKDTNGNVTGFVGTGRDISEYKAAEEKLKVAKEVAEDATHLKDKFVSLVAHDLSSPLASIIMLQKLAMSSLTDSKFDECRVSFGMTVGVCERILRMTGALLDLAGFQGGSIQLNRKICTIRDICDAVMGDLNYLAAKKGIVLKNEVPHGTKFYVDKVFFPRVIHNLVMNALKFSNKGGVVTVFMPGGQNDLAVKDTGNGIDEAILPDLFKSEVKTTTVGTSGEQGTGFGLPICMDIMKAHGGTIEVTTQKGEGSTFFVKVADMKPLVLVVDDDEVLMFTIRKYLEDMGAEVLGAKNGVEALEMIQGRPPILIITDIGMPVMNGFTLLQNLKTSAKYSHIPVLVMTGGYPDDIEVRKEAFANKAADFITKPLSEPDFIPRIGRFILG